MSLQLIGFRQGGEVEGLHAKLHVKVFIVLASGGQNHDFGQILTFWGAPVPTPRTVRTRHERVNSRRRHRRILKT